MLKPIGLLSSIADLSYCVDALLAALRSAKALSFRFLSDAKGWRMFVSTDIESGTPIRLRKGVIGVDVNQDCLTVTETDASGNPIATYRIPLVTYGCSSDQANDRIGAAVKEVIAIATYARKALAIEKLDFASKKQDLKDSGVEYARMLSSLAYSEVLSTVQARAFDAGLPVCEVNPA